LLFSYASVRVMGQRPIIGIFGGSGLYDMEDLSDLREETLSTPFGDPSDAYLVGQMNDTTLVFLPRHGRGHPFTPSEVNYRANIYGMKKLGVERIISVSAVGSMKLAIEPGHFVVVDQFLDRTKNRASTYFGQGAAGHVPFGDPVCSVLRESLIQAAEKADVKVHNQGTYICMEGPQYSTRAESILYQSWGVDVIGMTNLPEAKLAREAEICYATIAMATDYDCWHETEESVLADAVVQTFKKNIHKAKACLREAIALIPDSPRTCPCATALDHALVTAPEKIPAQTRENLKLFFGNRI